MSIRIGTASWSHPALIDSGRFYPSEAMTAEERLRHYASKFDLVELDSSYYRLPDPGQAQAWAARTPEGFTFNAKAFRLLTGHHTLLDALPADVHAALPRRLQTKSVVYYADLPKELVDRVWHDFVDGLAPLRSSGRLGMIHFQFAPWMARTVASRRHIAMCGERLAGHVLSVEFRNESWFEGANGRDTIAFLRELGVVHTVVDEPQGFRNSVPTVWEATRDDLALIRLHGRNADAWNHTGRSSSGRFNYHYDDAELEGLGHEIDKLSRRGLTAHVVFNNNAQDYAQDNALRLSRMMAEQLEPHPG